MSATVREPFTKDVGRDVEKNKPDAVMNVKFPAVTFLEGGAGENNVLAGLVDPAKLGRQSRQPGRAVVVAERMPGRHLVDVGSGVERVAFDESPVKRRGERGSDGRLAGAGRTHHDDRLRGHFLSNLRDAELMQ